VFPFIHCPILDAYSLALQRVFDCPYTEESVRGAKVIQPLVKSKRLHTLVVPKASSVFWAYSTFKQCPLQVMRIKKPVSMLERRYVTFENDATLVGLLKYTESEGPYVSDPPLIFQINFFCAAPSARPKHRLLF
jgi:hypothetical protein